jgi:hypothetical protein
VLGEKAGAAAGRILLIIARRFRHVMSGRCLFMMKTRRWSFIRAISQLNTILTGRISYTECYIATVIMPF